MKDANGRRVPIWLWIGPVMVLATLVWVVRIQLFVWTGTTVPGRVIVGGGGVATVYTPMSSAVIEFTTPEGEVRRLRYWPAAHVSGDQDVLVVYAEGDPSTARLRMSGDLYSAPMACALSAAAFTFPIVAAWCERRRQERQGPRSCH